MDLFLARHAESESNAGLTDSLDSDLTPLGRSQAERLAERLARVGITHAYVSPLRRALRTMAPIAALAGIHATLHADVSEYFSNHQYETFPGMDWGRIQREFPFARAGEDFPRDRSWWPGVEDEAAIVARAERVRDSLLVRYARTEAKLLIVSHSDPIGRLIEAFLRIPPRPVDPLWTDNCGLAILSCPSDPDAPATLITRNDTSHLAVMPWRP